MLIEDYDNFFLPTEDLEAARTFYGEVLGLSVKFDFSERGMIGFGVGVAEPAVILRDIRHFPHARPTMWFVVDDAREAARHLQEAGVKLVAEPIRIPTGWAVEFDDPFGNRLGFTDYQTGEE
ncbi:MAG TPA: VOC family protein [Armatimonadota bacterium]|jgi:predicted enzyme related to lactoylglutathione lyase